MSLNKSLRHGARPGKFSAASRARRAYGSAVRLLPLVLVVLATAASAEPHKKPSAPVDVAIAIKGDTATLTATPTQDVPAIELTLAGKTVTFGATHARVARTITAKVKDGDVVGQAKIGHRTKAALAHKGPIAVAKPV